MKKLITVKQMEEIGRLGNEGHKDALVAFGADMHRCGIYRGAATVLGGYIIYRAIGTIAYAINKRKMLKQK